MINSGLELERGLLTDVVKMIRADTTKQAQQILPSLKMLNTDSAVCVSAGAAGKLQHVQLLLGSIKTLEGWVVKELSVASQTTSISLDGLQMDKI